MSRHDDRFVAIRGLDIGDQYLISLSDAVTDVEGNRLDGEWTNPASISTVNVLVSEFPSGDGTPGGDFNFVATLLPGDANLDLVVDSTDFSILYPTMVTGQSADSSPMEKRGGQGRRQPSKSFRRLGSDPTGPISILADLNGDWVVDQSDADILYDNWATNLQNPTHADGDLNGDGTINVADLDLMFAQFGLELDVVS